MVHTYIVDPLFRQAVDLIDVGRVAELSEHLDRHPELLTATATFTETFFVSGTQPGQYFHTPRLLWFVAENPIRNDSLPDNIADVAQCIIDCQRLHGNDTLQHDLDYTLALVNSGNVPRKTGHQHDLVGVLVKNGADPNCADAALAHGEREAVQVLLDHGADVNLLIAAGMGMIDDLKRLLPDANEETKRNALSCAANCNQSAACRILLEHGVDPNRYNLEGFHAHCTPLHSAVSTGSYDLVDTFLSRGADPTIKDRVHDSDALGWARHMGHEKIVALIESSR